MFRVRILRVRIIRAGEDFRRLILRNAHHMKKLCLVYGVTLAVSASLFSITHAASMAEESVDAFENIFGVTEGKRRNHTKGFCFEATLTPVDPALTDLSTSELFSDASQVIGRLSHSGGNASASDDKFGGLGMGLQIQTSGGELHLMAMNTLDFFPVSTPEAFVALNVAKTGGKQAMAEYKKQYPQISLFAAHAAKADKTLKPYEAHQYNSVNSFYLVDSASAKTAVRWSFVPKVDQGIVVETGPDFFFGNIQENMKNGAVAWDMVVMIANDDDAVDDAAVQWTGEHATHVAATLTLNSVMSEEEGQCESINYDPLVLSAGFEPSDDPILQARRPSYAVSFGRRLSEQ